MTEWIIIINNPISELENELTRATMSTKLNSSNTMRKYILSMVPLVEKSVRRDLPNKICLFFDGWIENIMHYVAILAKYVKDGNFNEFLVAFFSIPEEGALGADQHISFIKETLAIF